MARDRIIKYMNYFNHFDADAYKDSMLQRSHRNIIFYLYITFFKLTVVQPSDVKSLNVLGFLPMSGSGWTGGAMCLPAALMAARHVNEREGLLDGYNLTYTWVDSQVGPRTFTVKGNSYSQKYDSAITLH